MEIMLAVPLTRGLDLAVESESRAKGRDQGFFLELGLRTGKSEVEEGDVRVGGIVDGRGGGREEFSRGV